MVKMKAKKKRANKTENRGFALMTPKRRQKLGKKGGILGHLRETAREWTSIEAGDASRKSATVRYRRKQEAAAIAGGRIPPFTDEQLRKTNRR